MRRRSTKYLKVLGPNSGTSGHVVVAADSHPNDPQVGRCAAPFAVVEEPNKQLGLTPGRTWVGIPAHKKSEEPIPINGVH